MHVNKDSEFSSIVFMFVVLCISDEINQRDDKQLDIKNLQEVYTELLPAQNEWKNLGLALGITDYELGNIESSQKNNKTQLREMLAHWLKSFRTWTDICNALREVTVQHNALAGQIQIKYCKTGK